MVELISKSKPKARKYHQCDQCGRSIAPGTVYSRWLFKDGGDIWAWTSHQDCQQLANAIHRARELDWDEGIRLLDEWADYPEETAAWRGYFPHVICRLEFHGQIGKPK
jgi:hypothetical protein